ncbi:MAG: hypothetical protein ACFB20_06795 [Opitutales bacterium]
MTSLKDQPTESLVGRKFRFIVSSAEEAVTLIRDNLGPKARVLTVKQVDGRGLTRFLSSPKLEVIATIPAEALEEPPADTESEEAKPQGRPTAPSNRLPAENPDSGVAFARKPASPAKVRETFAESANPSAPESVDSPAQNRPASPLLREPVAKQRPVNALTDLLRKAQFDDGLLSRLEDSPEWARLCGLPREQALAEVFQWLGQQLREIQVPALGRRIAFLGTPGVGKTTALCKQLAQEVFIDQTEDVSVVKLDHEEPNPDDALRTYCDVLGLPLMRESDSGETMTGSGIVFFDLPGLTLRDAAGWRMARERLDGEYVDTRVLVLNAAYDLQLLKEAVQQGHQIGATHLVFSHLDELTQPNRLWPCLLRSGLPTLFFSEGPGISGECARDVFAFMMDRALPALGGR